MTVAGPVREKVREETVKWIASRPVTFDEFLGMVGPEDLVELRGKKAFVMVLNDHHGDGRFALWCAAPEGMQQMLVEADPERFFVPPYVGHRGWLGVRLDRALHWDELAGIAEDAYAEVAPRKLVQAAQFEHG